MNRVLKYKYRHAVIIEPLTYVERQAAIALVKLGFTVEILPRHDMTEDFKLMDREEKND